MLAKNTRKIGDLGENIAKKFLLKKGYTIIFENINFSNQEVDIIAKKEKNYYIIEVKTSTEYSGSEPEDYFNKTKLNNLKKSAYYFSRKNRISMENIYIDLIAIKIVDQLKTAKIKHYKNIC